MNAKISALVAVASVGWTFAGHAQEVISVDETTVEQHVDHRVDPVYPPIAKAARVGGTVVLDVRVKGDGKVRSAKAVSGPPMLQQAAIDCVKQWTFHPFERDGSPIEATGHVSINFDLGANAPTAKEEEIAQRYFPLSNKCRQAVSARSDPANAAAVCKQAAETADEFGPDVRFIEKRSAFVWAAYALMSNRDLKTALFYAQKAVEVVKFGHDDNSGKNAAYGVKGMVEGNTGDFAASDRDLTIAEDFERKAIAWAEEEKFEHGDEYRRSLAQDLRFHAQVLQQLNRPTEAQQKLDEARKYE
ncbi:MAG TPA: energy transducer TonB [Terracidiphilus sp.]|nr:energy transducer TonB [Terracidiphilus sp.]